MVCTEFQGVLCCRDSHDTAIDKQVFTTLPCISTLDHTVVERIRSCKQGKTWQQEKQDTSGSLKIAKEVQLCLELSEERAEQKSGNMNTFKKSLMAFMISLQSTRVP